MKNTDKRYPCNDRNDGKGCMYVQIMDEKSLHKTWTYFDLIYRVSTLTLNEKMRRVGAG